MTQIAERIIGFPLDRPERPATKREMPRTAQFTRAGE
jgi:hypothetical protein